MASSDWGLAARGAALFDALDGDAATVPRRVLVVEACRLADRLEELSNVIAGKGVLDLMRFRLHESWGEDHDRTVLVRVQFDSVLAEARQSQLSLERLLRAVSSDDSGVAVEVDLGDDLAAQRAARIARAKGS